MRKYMLTTILLLLGCGMALADWGWGGLSGQDKAKLTALSMGLHCQGNIYYVSAKNGRATYDGTLPEAACSTVAQAYAKCVDGNGDMIALIPYVHGDTTWSFGLDTTLVIKKSLLTIHGVDDGNPYFGRVRICVSPATKADTGAQMAYRRRLIDVEAYGVKLENLFVINEDTVGYGGVYVGYNRCTIKNCAFIGAANRGRSASSADTTASYSLCIASSEVEVFDTWIGTNSTVQSAASAPLLLGNSTTTIGQILFQNCHILSNSNTSGRGGIYLANAATLGGWVKFEFCDCSNYYASVNPTALTSVVIGAASNNAGISWDKSIYVGWAALDATNSAITFANTVAGSDSVASHLSPR